MYIRILFLERKDKQERQERNCSEVGRKRDDDMGYLQPFEQSNRSNAHDTWSRKEMQTHRL